MDKLTRDINRDLGKVDIDKLLGRKRRPSKATKATVKKSTGKPSLKQSSLF